jgi:hypothetical protein
MSGQVASSIAPVGYKERNHASQRRGYEENGRDAHAGSVNRRLAEIPAPARTRTCPLNLKPRVSLFPVKL